MRTHSSVLLLPLIPLGSSSSQSQGPQSSDDSIRIDVLFDKGNLPWVEHLLYTTFSMLNDHSDGWFDDILDDGTSLTWNLRDSACDGTTAIRNYWGLREEFGGPPNAVVGCRCSESTQAVAMVGDLDHVPQISPSATLPVLSDKHAFPYFLRTASPNIADGIVSALRAFGWENVMVLATDTPFSTNLYTRFQELWTAEGGQISDYQTIALEPNGTIETPRILSALDNMPTETSRVIILLAHNQHAYSILEAAHNVGFQRDTTWVGTSAWGNRHPPGGTDISWMPSIPGYLGVTSFRNTDENYEKFLGIFQTTQRKAGVPSEDIWDDMPDYAAEYMVDAILSIVIAYSNLSKEQRRDPASVLEELHAIEFQGVSGRVGFDKNGDRAEPLFSVFNLQKRNTEWVTVGYTGTEVGSANIALSEVCYAEFGCGLDAPPSDSYPIEEVKIDKWVIGVILAISSLLLVAVLMFMRVRGKYKATKWFRKQGKKYPETWTNTKDILVEVLPTDGREYWDMLDKIRVSTPDGHISKLWRIQNKPLWEYHKFHENRFGEQGIPTEARQVWHGTRDLDPSVIYTCTLDGFMMQYARAGLWGCGIYFAALASYSMGYSFRPMNLLDNIERPVGKPDEHEIFSVKLLTGNEVKLPKDRELKVPPFNPQTGTKYNTVTGVTNGSQVWIVYENGRAYPEYLVRFYRGERDRGRTPYASRHDVPPPETPVPPESAPVRGMPEELAPVEHDQVPGDDEEYANSAGGLQGPAKSVVWEYSSKDNQKWKPYEPDDQIQLEEFYEHYKWEKDRAASSPLPPEAACFCLQRPKWLYEINMEHMTQRNMQYEANTVRSIRRRAFDVEAQNCV